MTIKQLLLFFTFTLSLYSNEIIPFTPQEEAYLEAKKEIRVCFSPKGLPLFGYKNGKNIGILPEVMHLIETKLPVPMRYIPVRDWDECVALSKEKKIDIASVILTAPNHHTHLISSKKVIDASIGIATKIREPLLSNSLDLNRKKIAFLKGQINIRAYVEHRFPQADITMVDSIQEGLQLVTDGKIFGYIDDTHSLAYHIIHLYSNELKIMERINTKPISGSVGIHKDEAELLTIFNKIIESIDEQEVRDIVHKWIAVRVENGFDYELLIQIVTVFLLILLVSLYWVRRLLREVKRRKIAEKELQEFNENLEKEISNKIKELHYKDAMLLEKTKLAAMGEMIGAIAHQWRRPLSKLHINIEMLEEDYKEQNINKEFLDAFISKNSEIIQFMSNTINDFQNFYKIDKEKAFFDVLETIQAVSNLHLMELEKHNISMTKQGKSFITLGYPSEFQQVILNLIANAKDALISKKVENPQITIDISSDKTKGYITISDNAGTIDVDMIDKIFEPYFTTKAESGGTGLGLYISKMIIEKNMQGELSISNNEIGTKLLIVLKKEYNEADI